MVELPVPDICDDSALLRVEACGICGSDAEQYRGVLPVSFPLIPGHEPLGVIEKIGDRAARRWGVDVGDRVVVETLIPCDDCAFCADGRYQLCRRDGQLFAYAYVPLSVEPGLWGAYADYMYLDPHSRVHKIDTGIPTSTAVMFNALGAGFRWAVEIPCTQAGETVLVLGPGQRGLASVIAAKRAGAAKVIVSGVDRDSAKLEMALTLGADHVINCQSEDLCARVSELTDGRGADVVVEVAADALGPVADAIRAVATGGRVVLAGVKGFTAVPDFVSDLIVFKEVRVMGVLGVTTPSYLKAIELIESGEVELDKLHTHSFTLEQAELAIQTLAGEIPGHNSVFSCITAGT
ncbi:MAG: alcohol dehydrogenase catalytic domain-containing protein [Deltaproteobacteria bacterium]